MRNQIGGSISTSLTAQHNRQGKSRRRSPSRHFSFRILRLVVCTVIALQVYLFLFTLQNSDSSSDETTSTSYSRVKAQRPPWKQRDNATATVAYAVSLIKCGDKQSNDAGLVDAALVMRHSIHKISIRNNDPDSSASKYDYRMYALVHKQAESCSHILKEAGFQVVIIEESPVKPAAIRGDYLRQNIHKEWCCGADEFIKLYAYTLPEPLVVHVDIDFVFLKPMDFLFDAILYPKDSPEGRQARSKIPLERPEEELPDTIDAFITRDWPQVIPGRKALYQAGFLVARRNPQTLEETINIIQDGNYTEGYTLKNGWGAAGYGGFVGAMAMQGLMAYYYDVVRPNTAVELNQCRFNHMGMDVRYRHPPNFISRKVKKIGKCRNFRDECEDCMITDVSLIYNAHFTECRKPWNCIGVGHGGGRIPGSKPGSAIDTNAGNFDHCMQLIKGWHDIRLDLENRMFKLTSDKTVLGGILGNYKRDIFRGHCHGEGGTNYTRIQGLSKTFEQIQGLYD